MTDDDLAAKMADIRDRAEHDIDAIREMATSIREAEDRDVAMVISEAGRDVCPACRGFGAVERMDSGYMRRFGLREWDGCTRCGGNGGEIRGRGFVGRET
jgi:hypothetical protein